MKGVTAYQLEVLQLAQAGNPDGEGPVDFDQVLEQLSWEPTKQAAQFTIRAVVTKGLLEKGPLTMRRGRRRVTYLLTGEGLQVLDPRIPSVRTEPEKASEVVSGESESSLPEDLFGPGEPFLFD